MPYMYILECNDGTFYTGSTWNLEKRVFEHNNGIGANYTSKRLPVKLVYCEEYDRIDEAFYREKQVQSWSRAKKKALISGKYDTLQFFAKKAFSKRKPAPFDTPLRGTQGTDPDPIRSSSSEAYRDEGCK